MNRVIQGKCLDTPFLIFFLRGNPTGFQSVLLNRANNWIQYKNRTLSWGLVTEEQVQHNNIKPI